MREGGCEGGEDVKVRQGWGKSSTSHASNKLVHSSLSSHPPSFLPPSSPPYLPSFSLFSQRTPGEGTGPECTLQVNIDSDALAADDQGRLWDHEPRRQPHTSD